MGQFIHSGLGCWAFLCVKESQHTSLFLERLNTAKKVGKGDVRGKEDLPRLNQFAQSTADRLAEHGRPKFDYQLINRLVDAFTDRSICGFETTLCLLLLFFMFCQSNCNVELPFTTLVAFLDRKKLYFHSWFAAKKLQIAFWVCSSIYISAYTLHRTPGRLLTSWVTYTQCSSGHVH